MTKIIRKLLTKSVHRLGSGKIVNEDPARSKEVFGVLVDSENGLYIENYFLEMLYLERKRSERLRNPFLLMLLHINGLPENSQKDGIHIISRSLSLFMREVDIKGWFREKEIVGAIFPGAGTLEIEKIKVKFYEEVEKYEGSKHWLIQNVSVTFHSFPDYSKGDGTKNRFDQSLYPDISSKYLKKKNNFLIKRVMDIFGSLAAILIFSPVFLLVPFLIKMTSAGPVFFRQKRVGRYGESFTLLKFRTMHNNNDPKVHKEYVKKLIREHQAFESSEGDSKAVYKIKGDSRITQLGNFLRKTSLDEFPQFFNVLKGEMSLVGPRPPILYELEEYDIWHLRRVLEVQPGITGLWQVTGRSRTTFNEMVRLDLRYINEWSIWLDIKLILQTPWSVFSGRGAH